MRAIAAGFSALALLSAASVCAQPAPSMPKESGTSVHLEAQGGFAKHEMVAAAEPLAVQAGLRVLHAGGTAADAAVAVQAVLGLVEPQSSGLAGGAFMIFYDGETHKVTAYNGRETAPAGARPDMFLGADGKPMPFVQAILSGRSTGAPGAVAMLALAHKQHGRLAWSGLFGDAIRLADQGFPVTPRLAADIVSKFPQAATADAVAYFHKPDGQPYLVGEPLKNPAYASTLRRLAAEGPAGLLGGKVAQDIADRVHANPIPGTLGVADIAAYRPQTSDPLCRPFNVYLVCAPPAPSGGLGLLELLGELNATDIASRGPSDPQAWYAFAQASRLAYADRDRYEGDPDFVHVPVAGLLDPAYDAARAKLIPTTGAPAPDPGVPMGAVASLGRDHTAEPGGTTEFVIVDRFGDVVSMTTTVESIFGSGAMVDGFFLNNQLTDFSFSPTEPSGQPAANAVAAGKRPRSSMTPVIVLDRQGRFVMALGAPGGNSIIAYVAKVLIGLIDWKLPIEQALALPNIVARGATVAVEKGADPAIVAALQAHGLNVQPGQGEESGVQVVVAVPGGLRGGADPRREGVARGD